MSRWYWIASLLLVAACHGTEAPPASPASPPAGPSTPAAARTPETDGLFDVGGLKLHLHCVGEGSPVVVLDSGLGGDASVWSDVEPEVSRLTRVCAYDRAGLGKSSPAPRPHTSRQMARELHALLERAAVSAPYVLVGHSLGGLNVRLFASEHAPEVSGMVLVDTAMPRQDTRAWGLIPEGAMRDFRAALADGPEGLDYESFCASMADVGSSSKSLGDVPLVVLTHGKREDPPPGATPELADRLERIWQEMQSELPGLSSNSVRVVAPSAGHFIQRDAPRLVVAAVQAVVKAARTHERVDAGEMSAFAREGKP